MFFESIVEKTFFRNIALIASSVALALVVGELAARAVFRDVTTTTDNRSYFALKWKAANVRRNSFGYREREIDPSKPAGAYRIAMIGDSFTLGQGMDEADRMSNLLENELRARIGHVEVLNFGNEGNNTADEVRVLQDVVLNVEPDFVLLQWFVNDVENNRHELGASLGIPSEPSRIVRLKQLMRNHSVIYFLAAEAWHRVLDNLGGGYAHDMLSRFEDPMSPDWLAAEQSLIHFIQACKISGVPVGIVLVPVFTPLADNEYPFAYLHDRVVALCESEGVPCVDLLSTFRQQLADGSNYKRLWVNRFDSHMGPEANRLATARLLDYYGSTWAHGAEASSFGPSGSTDSGVAR